MGLFGLGDVGGGFASSAQSTADVKAGISGLTGGVVNFSDPNMKYYVGGAVVVGLLLFTVVVKKR